MNQTGLHVLGVGDPGWITDGGGPEGEGGTPPNTDGFKNWGGGGCVERRLGARLAVSKAASVLQRAILQWHALLTYLLAVVSVPMLASMYRTIRYVHTALA